MTVIVLGALIVISGVAAVGAMVLVRRLFPRESYIADPERTASTYQAIGTMYAVLLAFVVFVAFESYGSASDAADDEAVAVVQEFRSAEIFPSTQRAALRAELICYGRAVAADEWRAMRHFDHSRVVDRWSALTESTTKLLNVRNTRRLAAYRKVLDQQDALVEARRRRLSEASPAVTTPVWVVLAIGGLLNIALAVLYVDRRELLGVQAAFIAAVAVMIATGLSLVWFLDHPYSTSPGSVRPSEMRFSVGVMEGADPTLDVPCTPQGQQTTSLR